MPGRIAADIVADAPALVPPQPTRRLDGTPISIVMTINDAYTEGFLCAVRSILDHADRPIELSIISVQSDPIWTRSASVLDGWGASYSVIRPPALALAYAGSRRLLDPEVKQAHYLRLWIADLLPHLNRVLYLDCDLIVRRSLTPLWETRLDGALLAAVADPVFLEPHEAAFLQAHGGRYFNSGVMLIDLAQWRAADLTARTLDWVTVYQRANGDPRWRQFWDQSPLNMAVRSRWLSLGPAWNLTPVTRAGQAQGYGLTPAGLDCVMRDPAIFHFIGPLKPWKRPDVDTFAPEFAAIAERVGPDWHRGRLTLPQAAPAADCDLRTFAGLVFEAVETRLSPVRLIQIGTPAELSDHPIDRFITRATWVALLIEPTPHLFYRLCRTYAGLPTVEIATETACLDDIADRHGIEPDVLVLATAGHDAGVLDGLDRLRPMAVHVAIANLPAPEQGRLFRRLKRFGYVLLTDGDTALALQPSLLSDARVADGFSRLPLPLVR